MATFRLLEARDNKELATIIRSTLESFGLNIPGTVYTDPATDNLFDLFQCPGSIYFVALEGEQILGGCGIYPTPGLPPGCTELVKLYLRPEARGLGLGKQLMQKSLAWAQDFGYREIYLESFPELASAVTLYEQLGFHMLEGPMGNSGHHACQLWMLKRL